MFTQVHFQTICRDTPITVYAGRSADDYWYLSVDETAPPPPPGMPKTVTPWLNWSFPGDTESTAQIERLLKDLGVDAPQGFWDRVNLRQEGTRFEYDSRKEEWTEIKPNPV